MADRVKHRETETVPEVVVTARQRLRTSAVESATVTLPGIVEKIITSPDPTEPEKVQITVDGADDLYREIRIGNTLQTSNGEAVTLKIGARVNVTVEASAEAITPKKSPQRGRRMAAPRTEVSGSNPHSCVVLYGQW